MKNTMYFLRLLKLTILLVFALSGCVPILKASSELKIGYQEKWDFSLTLVVAPQISSILVAGLNQQFIDNTQIKQAGVQAKINQLTADPNGNIPVQLIMNGQGYDAFRTVFGQNALTVEDVNGVRTLTFNLNTFANGMVAPSTEFILSGGKILNQTGGTLVDGNTVKWVNYLGFINATMQEPTFIDSNLFWIGGTLAFLALAGIVIAIILTLKRQRSVAQRGYVQPRSSYTPTISQPHTKRCKKCRAQIPAHAIFCVACGTRQV